MSVSRAGWAGAQANLNAAEEQLQATAEGLEAYYQQVLHGGQHHEPAVKQAQDRLSTSVRSTLQDVDLDGDLDMLLFFRTQDTGIACGQTSATLTGQTSAGIPIQGSDSIKTVPCK